MADGTPSFSSDYPEMGNVPRIVIVGAGFGGLEAARALRRAPVEVVLVDRNNHHCFQPLLYQVATAALSPGDIAWPIRSILRSQKNVRVLLGSVRGVDIQNRLVDLGDYGLGYDTLVLATGATHSYFGHEIWAPYAPGLKEIADATAIRRRLLLAFEHAEVCTNAQERARLLTFVIVGGGPTGVEMAGAMAELARQTLRGEFRTFDPAAARIVLLEAGPRILSAFSEAQAGYVLTSLRKKGVEVMTGTAVTGCDARGVDTAGGRIESACIIWAAGVTASAAADWLGAAHDRSGRIQVAPDLTVPNHPEIFAIGDTATVRWHDEQPVPGLAPAAKQMGRYVGQVIAARAAGHSPLPAFRYRHEGDLATIGRHAAIVSLDRFELTGFLGWLFWSLVHIYFLIGARNRIAIAFKWAWDYVTFQRGVRLIVPGRDIHRQKDG